jgi:exonuclease III
LQETIRKDFSQRELDELTGNQGFKWVWKEAVGHSGGILLGVIDDLVEVEETEIGEFYVSMVLRHRLQNFRWEMVVVYGPAQHDWSREFIAELSRKCLFATLPMVLGGDFNLIREVGDKNNKSVNLDLMNMFIDHHQLQEIRKNGTKFTWSNKQSDIVMVNLDRVLVSTEWEAHYPLCFAWSKTRVGLDHCPIIMDTGEGTRLSQRYFYFENQWFGGGFC